MTPDDELLERAIAIANIPTLLMILVQFTGELHWLEPPYLPTRNRGLSDNDTGGLPEQQQREIRSAALAAIRRWRQDGQVAIAEPSPELLLRMMSVAMGEEVPDGYAPMMAVEFGADDTGEKRFHRPPPGFHALVIGGGVSGICAAKYLTDRGIRCTVVEKSSTIGGTWHDNRYPGAGVDTPSHLYSFSFAKYDWTSYFAGSEEIWHYLKTIADSLTCEFRLRTEAISAVYDEAAQEWAVTLRHANGEVEQCRANVVISAVGALNRPVTPRIEGLDRFRGLAFHSARWPRELDLTGKRVAVVGTGASAMQIVPAVAEQVRSLTIFQRSPQWAVPFEKFHQEIPAEIRYLFKTVPHYEQWYRLRLQWTFNDKIHHTLQKDPEWSAEASINEVNEGYRQAFVRYMKRELGDRQDLMPAVEPRYPPFLKRMLLDNGWFRTLTRENVHLVTGDDIASITEDSVVTEAGAEHPADVIVLATGFDAIHFLASIEVIGRSGRPLSEVWDDDARAYLGMAVPDFPNFFTMYGPNLQPGHGGSLMFIFECQMNYIADLLDQMFVDDIGAVECRKDVYDEYNDGVDAAHEKMIWTHPGANTYYRNSRGRVVLNNPYRVIEYWNMTRAANIEEYVTEKTCHTGGR